MKRRYPLEALQASKQRDKEATAAAASIATARRAEAEEAAARARASHRRGSEALGARLTTERARVDAGLARAGDLASGELHRRDAEEKLRLQAEEERVAEGRAARSRRLEAEARHALGRAHGAERAVDAHRARFNASGAREDERREEEDAGDAWAAARRGTGRDPAR